MKHYIIFIALSCLSIFNINSQKPEKINYISGCLYGSSMKQYSVSLYDALGVKVQELVADSMETKFVRYYKNEAVVSILCYDRIRNMNYLLLIDSKGNIRTSKIQHGNTYYCTSANMIKGNSGHLMQSVELYDYKANDLKYIAIDVETGDQTPIKREEYKHVVISGEPGGAIEGGDNLILKSNSMGDLLVPSLNGKVVVFDKGVNLPKKFLNRELQKFNMHLNTDDFLLLSTRIQKKAKKENYYLYDKASGKWKVFINNGMDLAYIRCFDNWIVGSFIEYKDESINASRESKGFNDKKSLENKNGIPVNNRYEARGIYSAGQLFVHDFNSNKTIQFNVDHGDSEILLVNGLAVYYRVNDSIYKAIIEKNKVVNDTLLFQHEDVRNIHWATIYD